MKNLFALVFLGFCLAIGTDNLHARTTHNDDRDTMKRKERRIQRKKEKAEKTDKGDGKITISERGTPTDKPRREKESGETKEQPKQEDCAE